MDPGTERTQREGQQDQKQKQHQTGAPTGRVTREKKIKKNTETARGWDKKKKGWRKTDEEGSTDELRKKTRGETTKSTAGRLKRGKERKGKEVTTVRN